MVGRGVWVWGVFMKSEGGKCMEGRKWCGESCIDYIIQHNPILHNFPYFLR